MCDVGAGSARTGRLELSYMKWRNRGSLEMMVVVLCEDSSIMAALRNKTPPWDLGSMEETHRHCASKMPAHTHRAREETFLLRTSPHDPDLSHGLESNGKILTLGHGASFSATFPLGAGGEEGL